MKTVLISLFSFLIPAAVSQAATAFHSVPFTFSESYTNVSGSQSVFDSSFLNASVPAFDSSLGQLESFSVTWTISGTFSGTLSTGGGVSSAYSGSFYVDGLTSPGVIYPSGGGGNGNGGPPGFQLNLALTGPGNPLSFTQIFVVSEAGTAYPQQVLDAVTGTEPVELQWQTGLTINGDWTTLAVSGTASAEIAYDYVPEPSSLLLSLAGGGLMLIRRRGR